jgi:hypothetical protein
MALPVITPVNVSATGSVKAGAGKFYGFVVNSHTSGTLKLWDNTAGSGKVILNTITFAAGSGIATYFTGGINFTTGLFFTAGGTIDITFLVGELNG